VLFSLGRPPPPALLAVDSLPTARLSAVLQVRRLIRKYHLIIAKYDLLNSQIQLTNLKTSMQGETNLPELEGSTENRSILEHIARLLSERAALMVAVPMASIQLNLVYLAYLVYLLYLAYLTYLTASPGHLP
jgi:hypothetical protein